MNLVRRIKIEIKSPAVILIVDFNNIKLKNKSKKEATVSLFRISIIKSLFEFFSNFFIINNIRTTTKVKNV
jgi:hypothetical protein